MLAVGNRAGKTETAVALACAAGNGKSLRQRQGAEGIDDSGTMTGCARFLRALDGLHGGDGDC